MTDISERRDRLAPAVERFILQWGNMGGAWGVNRSVSQIHALLYVSERPLTAEEIAEGLGLARSNVSNSLKELMGWKLIRLAPVKGDRRDYFEAETDLWEVAALIAAGRKQREIDPAITALKASMIEAESDALVHPVARQRLKAMLEFTETVDRWHTQMLGVPKAKLAALIGLGARIVKYLPLGKASGP
jgi:DNA-binding transcriptional regulator GbsR (MarR family)